MKWSRWWFIDRTERTHAMDEETHRQMVAALECSTGMCEHMVGDRHPQLMQSSNGKRYWRLDAVMWEEGTPCPIDRSAPTAEV